MAFGIPAFSLSRFGAFGSSMNSEMVSLTTPRDEFGKIIPMHSQGHQEENYNPVSVVPTGQMESVVATIASSQIMYEMSQSPMLDGLVSGLLPNEHDIGQVQTTEVAAMAPVPEEAVGMGAR